MRESTVRPKEPKRTRRRSPGIGSVYQVASGKWRASVLVIVDGEPVRKLLQADTSAAVIDRLQTAQADADKAAALAASPTLAWWANRWLDSVALRVRASTLRTYETAIRSHVLPVLGSRPLAELRPADIEQLLAGLVARGLASSSAALTRRTDGRCRA